MEAYVSQKLFPPGIQDKLCVDVRKVYKFKNMTLCNQLLRMADLKYDLSLIRVIII